jgi:hypothetical protein
MGFHYSHAINRCSMCSCIESGNSHRGCLYWVMTYENIISFDNTTMTLYYVQCPQETHDDILNHRLHTIKGKNGGVGLAILRGFTLHTWCSVRSSAIDHVWILEREVDLSNLLVLDTSLSYDGRCNPKILCACEDREYPVVNSTFHHILLKFRITIDFHRVHIVSTKCSQRGTSMPPIHSAFWIFIFLQRQYIPGQHDNKQMNSS